MIQTDPTIAALADLDVPGRYHVRKGVPIFVEHTDPKTGEKIDRARLEELARINNRRMVETDTPGSIIIGHTPGRPEEALQHVGFRKNYHVGRFGTKQRLGLLCDFYYKQETYSKAKHYPHRSIELWKDGTIDVCSVLAQTPQLDLGLLLPDEGPVESHVATTDGCELLCYSRGGERRLYQMSEEQPLQLKEFLDGLKALVDKAYEACGTDTQPETFGAMPSGTNTAMAEQLKDQPKMYSKEEYEKLQIERDEAVRKGNEAVKLYQKQTRIQALEKLKGEGVLLEVDTEYSDTEGLDEASFTKHLEKVKKCYARGAATGGFIGLDPSKAAGDADTEYARLRPQVLAYAEKHKVNTNDAFQAVRAGQK
jgi:hypothetical protein